ncbi:MAG TPA: prolipoprotein diacylglyceryl transferase, partial [Bacteroidales bacterium]|nr:prolipoprotein diacylglyceryl transferase [Bacteroidales bacterium]
FLILVFAGRFLMEFLKNNQVAFENNMFLNMGQLLSLPFVFAGAALIAFALKNSQKTASV